MKVGGCCGGIEEGLGDVGSPARWNNPVAPSTTVGEGKDHWERWFRARRGANATETATAVATAWKPR